MKNNKHTGWGGVASWYKDTVEAVDSTQQSIILPALLASLKNSLKDKVVLDLGCGTGFFIHTFLMLGAKKVIAVDVDESLLKVVREKYAKNEKVEIKKLDAEKLEGIEIGSVDVIVSIESLVNIRRLDKVMSEVKRVLSKNGKFIAIVNHPCFRVPQSSDWHYDAQKKSQGRVVYKYGNNHEIKIDMNPGSRVNKKFTYTFHRTLSEYMKFFKASNMSLIDVEEIYSNKTSQNNALRKKEEDIARKEIPMFLTMYLQKN